jgi:hypothetical protein
MKKKRKKSNLWIYYWIGMAMGGVAIIGMVIYLVARKPAATEIAVAPTQPEAAKPAMPSSKPAEIPAQESASKPVDTPRQEEVKPREPDPVLPTEVTPKQPDLPPKEEAAPSNAAPEPKPVEPTSVTVGISEGNQIREIDGVDLQGKKFKLSDYRGKVVLLDFWGFW